jgi:hypothetical protein
MSSTRPKSRAWRCSSARNISARSRSRNRPYARRSGRRRRGSGSPRRSRRAGILGARPRSRPARRGEADALLPRDGMGPGGISPEVTLPVFARGKRARAVQTIFH